MINSIVITNHLNESITFELTSPEKSGFRVLSVDGLGPPKADIFINAMAGLDGGIHNSARTNTRNIVFTLQFMPKPSIEHTRQLTYKYFPLKQRIKITTHTSVKSTYTYGYVETNEPSIFSDKEGCVISVICPDPNVYNIYPAAAQFGALNHLFEFPFSNESVTLPLIEFSEISSEATRYIVYRGEVDVGVVIHIHILDDSTGVTGIAITDENSNTIALNDAKMEAITGDPLQPADDIWISTLRGDKYAKLMRDAVEYDILNALGEDPEWFVLNQGDNMFAYSADTGVLFVVFKILYELGYQGV